MNKAIETHLESIEVLEGLIDAQVGKLISEKLKELRKQTGDKWGFWSGHGTFYFTRNSEILHDPVPETQEFLAQLDELHEKFVRNGYYPPHFGEGETRL